MKTFSQSNVQDWTFRDRPTLNYLLSCISANTDSQTIHHIQTLAQGEIDWQFLAQIAKDHRVVPLLYNRLKTTCPDTVPAALLSELRGYCKGIAIRNLSTTAELRRLLALMEVQGIDTLPYKGPVLTQMLYENLEMRQFGDLDIVIQPEAMRAVEALLIAEGYQPYFGEKTAAELAAYMKSKNEHTYDFYHERKHIFIEIHWRFWPSFFSSVSPKDIWHRRESTQIAGQTVSNFKIEDYLIILCMHGSRHQWERLSWLCDIALLIHKYPNLNWQQLFALSDQWGTTRMLNLGLYLAHAWLKAPLPETVTDQISADSTIGVLATQVHDQIFVTAKPSVRFMGTTRYHLQARERWQDKALYAQSFVHWLLKGCPSEHHTT
jgi:Uncharacterised nucleotidyltransferase